MGVKNYKGFKVDIVPASKYSKKFIIWDIRTNQKFSNEKFNTIGEAKQFIIDNEMILM